MRSRQKPGASPLPLMLLIRAESLFRFVRVTTAEHRLVVVGSLNAKANWLVVLVLATALAVFRHEMTGTPDVRDMKTHRLIDGPIASAKWRFVDGSCNGRLCEEVVLNTYGSVRS